MYHKFCILFAGVGCKKNFEIDNFYSNMGDIARKFNYKVQKVNLEL